MAAGSGAPEESHTRGADEVPVSHQRVRRVGTELGEAIYDEESGAWRLLRGSPGSGAESVPVRGAPVDVAPWPRAQYPDAIPTLVLNTHRSCGLRCRYCFAHLSEADYGLPPMPLEVAAGAAEFLCTELGKEAPSVVLRSTLLGEPSLELEFTEALGDIARECTRRHGKRVEWHWAATTNLVQLPPEEVMRRLPWMTVSLDGWAVVQNAMRPSPDGSGSYETVVRARGPQVNQLNPLGPYLGANATLTARYPDVSGIFRHLYELGFGTISISPVRMAPGGIGAITEQTVQAVKFGYSQFVEFLLGQDPDLLLSYLRPLFQPSDFLGRFLLRADGGKAPYRCEAGKWSLAVDTEGALPVPAFVATRAYRMG